jgi:DNA mismatch repair ATPase MutS
MSELDSVATTTLLTDANKDLLARMLEKALQQALVPMEPAAAKTYMEQVAQRTALDEGVDITLFQMIQLRSSESTYVMRVALLSDNRAIGLDVMDAENGQFFIPESCPVCQLAAATVN